MSYPTLEQYQERLQYPAHAFTEPELQQGQIKVSGLGTPLALCGGFALTYTVTVGNRRYAVRCFHKESKSLEARYMAISKRLKSLNSGYFVDFVFQPQGVRLNGKCYPIVKMAWASGETLGEFLETNHRNKDVLTQLRKSVQELAAYLSQQGIAHGDIQTGNLMVSDGGKRIQLIDYDGMFVEELKALGSAEVGHRNFQHPERINKNPYNASLDRFSLISLSLALRTLENDPGVWSRARCDIDGIVFRANDFQDVENSLILRELATKSSLGQDIKHFAAICKATIESVPSLDEFLAGRNIPQVRLDFSARLAPVKPRLYISAYPVLDADYQRCSLHVGDLVELIGKVVEVRQDKTRYGKPYVFVNFGPWQGNIVKINIWSEGLAALANKPDRDWVGRWISVVGLMEPPYENRRFRYSHLAITISQNNQITILDETEAKFRLTATHSPKGSAVGVSLSPTSNSDILREIGNRSGQIRSQKARKAAAIPTPPLTNNQALLMKIKGTTPSAQQSKMTMQRSSVTGQKKGFLAKIWDFLFR